MEFIGQALGENVCTRRYKCIVVGAGISGLQTAYGLVHDHGFATEDILILEAQDYIGGRIKQTRDFIPGIGIDLGAEILHGANTLLTRFAKKHGEPMEPIYCWAHGDGGPLPYPVQNGYGLYYIARSGNADSIDGARLGDRLLRYDDEDQFFVQMNEALWELSEMKEDTLDRSLSLADYVNSKLDRSKQTLAARSSTKEKSLAPDESEEVASFMKKRMFEMAAAGFANTLCTNMTDLSLQQAVRWNRMWSEEEQEEVDGAGGPSAMADQDEVCAGGDFRLLNTFGAVISKLKENLNIKLNAPVKRICYHAEAKSHSGSTVTVHTIDGSKYTSDCIVVTASPHVLRSQKLLEFCPPLSSEKLDVLNNSVCMHRALKVLLKFSDCPWPRDLHGAIFVGDFVDEDSLFLETEAIPTAAVPENCFLLPEIWFRDYSERVMAAGSSQEKAETSGCAADASKPTARFLAVGFSTARYADIIANIRNKGDVQNKVSADCDGESPQLSGEQLIFQLMLAQLDRMHSKIEDRHMRARVEEGTMVDDANEKETRRVLPRPSDVFLGGMLYEWYGDADGDLDAHSEYSDLATDQAAADCGGSAATIKRQQLQQQRHHHHQNLPSISSSGMHRYIGGGYGSPLASARARIDYGAVLSTPCYASSCAKCIHDEPSSSIITETAFARTAVDNLLAREQAADHTAEDLKPVPCVFFAGEAVNGVRPGATAHSAMETGVVAAQMVAERLSAHR